METLDLNVYLREYERLLAHFRNPETHQPGIIRVLDWEVEYVFGPTIPAHLEYQFIRGVNDFYPDNDNPLILDCGANIGLSVLAYKRKYPQARIIAFEPDPQFLPVLQRNLERNRINNVEVVGKAVWYQDGQASWYCQGIDGSKLVPASSSLDHLITVDTVNLANYLTVPVDLIKMDIEGSEYALMTHLRGMLVNVKNMSIECHVLQETFPDFCCLISFLKEEGFNLGVNSLNWRDLVNQPEIPPEHFSQYIVVSAWRHLPLPIHKQANYSRLAPNLPVEYELRKLEFMQKDHLLNSLQEGLAEREQMINSREQEVETQLQDISAKNQELAEEWQNLRNKETTLAESVQKFQNEELALAERQHNIKSQEQELGSAQQVLTERQYSIEAKEQELETAQQVLTEKQHSIETKEQELETKNQELQTRFADIEAREQQYAHLLIVRLGRRIKRTINKFWA